MHGAGLDADLCMGHTTTDAQDSQAEPLPCDMYAVMLLLCRSGMRGAQRDVLVRVWGRIHACMVCLPAACSARYSVLQ